LFQEAFYLFKGSSLFSSRLELTVYHYPPAIKEINILPIDNLNIFEGFYYMLTNQRISK